ncbi:MAG: molecular chaperone DnaJ [Alphaproteobacteria bacterium BRH_c36]|nr:MAG: molecular chaperone DnaJ [Alphaproteobacteria bacterium BRH_c36]
MHHSGDTSVTAADPYATLGVSRDAGDDEIRRAFRKLAKELHPDLHPDNPTAADRFKRVSAAYDILGDPPKRRQFDNGEIDAAGEPRRGYRQATANGGNGHAGPHGFEGFSGIFEEMFAANRGHPGYRGQGAGQGADKRGPGGLNRRGQDVRYTLEVDFDEAITGVKKRVTMPEGGILDLNVPEGVADSQILRLRGKGGPGLLGGEHGDALVEIKVRPHPRFRREGLDIYSDVPITVDEAVLGGKIEVSTISTRVQLTLPKGTSSGRMFRLKGKGVRNAKTGETGDQIVTVRIVMPEQVDDELAYFFSTWKQKRSYDPGPR